MQGTKQEKRNPVPARTNSGVHKDRPKGPNYKLLKVIVSESKVTPVYYDERISPLKKIKLILSKMNFASFFILKIRENVGFD